MTDRRTLMLECSKGAPLSARLKQGSLSDEERRQCRRALADFFRKALAPSRAQRHPSAAAMHAALLAALGIRASLSDPAPPHTHLGTGSQRCAAPAS